MTTSAAGSTGTPSTQVGGGDRRRPLRVAVRSAFAPRGIVSILFASTVAAAILLRAAVAVAVADARRPARSGIGPPTSPPFFAAAFCSPPASRAGCRIMGPRDSSASTPHPIRRGDEWPRMRRHGGAAAPTVTAGTAFCRHHSSPRHRGGGMMCPRGLRFQLSVAAAPDAASSSDGDSSRSPLSSGSGGGGRRRRGAKSGRKSFDDWYRELSAYSDVQGDCLVPQSGNHAPLGRWVARQRLLRRQRRSEEKTGKGDDDTGGDGRLTDERIRMLDDLGFCWDVRDAQWNARYEQLRKFHGSKGHCRVPLDGDVSGTGTDWDADASHNLALLHHWTNEQRKRYRRKALTPERIGKLNEIGFQWFAPSSHSVAWREKFDQLCQYRRVEGDCMVPKTYGPDPELGYWVTRQRERYKLRLRNRRNDDPEGDDGGENSSSSSGSTAATSAAMTGGQVDMLNSIGFVWDASRSEWNRRYREFVECIKKDGDDGGGDFGLDVDFHVNEGTWGQGDAAALRTWVETQQNQVRRHLGGKSCVLSETQLDKLRQIGIGIDRGRLSPSSPSSSTRSPTNEVIAMPPPPSVDGGVQYPQNRVTKRTNRDDERWEDMFGRLCEYLSIHGDTLVPLSYDADPSLGSWVRNQREQHRRLLNGEYTFLTRERVEALEGVGFAWRVDRWRTRYDDLCDYVAVHGDADVPEFYPDNVPLGVFVSNQRTQRRYMDEGMKTTLTKERVEALDRLGFRWSWAASNWLDMLGWLKRYKAEHGHLYVSPTDEENRALRLWASHQRHQYRKLTEHPGTGASTMTPDRLRALEDVGFEWRVRRKSKLGGPSAEDWSKLFQGMRGSGIDPEKSKAKEHWFDGVPRTDDEGWDVDEAELLRLWNEEDEEETEDL